MEILQLYFAVFIMFLGLFLNCYIYIDWNYNLTAYIRLFLPIILFSQLDPVAAMIILEGVLDSIEPNISRNNIEYHTRDKLLDLWGWVVSIIALWTITKSPVLIKYRNILTILFLFRAIGNILFIITKQRKWLSLFPNLYSLLFIILPILDYIGINKGKRFRCLIFLIILIKILIEFSHHGINKSKDIKNVRRYIKYICPGKYKMYLNTGTYPNNPIKNKLKKPLLIIKR